MGSRHKSPYEAGKRLSNNNNAEENSLKNANIYNPSIER
jgi:hypothetical protein